jgi:N-acetylglucosamine-6-phosphate deacetylase
VTAAPSQRILGRDPSTGRGVAVTAEGGVITAIEFQEHGEKQWLSAGFVDLQVNGYAGHDLNGPTLDVATVRALCQAMLKVGVTTFLPTLITAPEVRLVAALRTIREACAQHPDVAAMVAGIHIEGPHIAPEDGPRGAHPAADVRPPCIAEFDRWQQAAGGLVKLVTLSPHWPEAPAYIRHLVKAGVTVSLGHTSADAAQIAAALAKLVKTLEERYAEALAHVSAQPAVAAARAKGAALQSGNPIDAIRAEVQARLAHMPKAPGTTGAAPTVPTSAVPVAAPTAAAIPASTGAKPANGPAAFPAKVEE